jgi:hypothetical protein
VTPPRLFAVLSTSTHRGAQAAQLLLSVRAPPNGAIYTLLRKSHRVAERCVSGANAGFDGWAEGGRSSYTIPAIGEGVRGSVHEGAQSGLSGGE